MTCQYSWYYFPLAKIIGRIGLSHKSKWYWEMDTQILKHGSPARLFPVVPDGSKEQRTLSIVLATTVSVRPFAAKLLDSLGVRLGKRSKISCFTEVTLTNEVKSLKDRPDALIIVETGKNSWSALVEAKVGKQKVETEQLERYIELARINNIDAVITVSNELSPDPTINPTELSKALPKKIGLFHLSWAAILTQSFLLASSKEDPFENDDELFLVSELIRYLEHTYSGRIPLDQMNKDWPKLVSDIQSGHPLNPKSPEISEMITIWHQEARDVALIMTRQLGEPVSTVVARRSIQNRAGWIEGDAKQFCNDKLLGFELDVPNAASKISVEADFRRRSIRSYMKLSAPTDRKSNGARLNWLLKQLNKSDLSKIIITCITHGRAHNFGAMAHEIDPLSYEIKELNEIVSFQVEMSADLGKYFNSRKKFVEYLEQHVPYFYKNVAEHLKGFVASPPKLKKQNINKETVENNNDELSTSAKSEATERKTGSDVVRPSWASSWQSPQEDIEHSTDCSKNVASNE